MTRIYLPSRGAQDWRVLLADPVKHWRAGFSAMTLASCWEAAKGFPPEIAALFGGEDRPELLVALPEHKVPLPGSHRGESQGDVFALVRAGERTYAVTIEGKVDEPFDRRLDEWLVGASAGKIERLAFIADVLGLTQPLPGDVYYQLLHRSAAAVIEARRFKTDAAAMIVHSFSPTGRWYEEFERFAGLWGVSAVPDKLLPITTGRLPLFIGWVAGDSRFLASEPIPGVATSI